MPIRPIFDSNENYYLIVFDRDGREVKEGGNLLSARITADHPEATDVFVFMHGWMGDFPAAIDQYDRWIKAMAMLPADRAEMVVNRPDGFRPVWIGLHWPSLPWGDEHTATVASFAAGALDVVVDDYLEKFGGDKALSNPLRTIVGHAQVDPQPYQMPVDVKAAYDDLNAIIGLAADGVNAPPDADRKAFDAAEQYETMKAIPNFGGGIAGTLLSPLRTLSFWAMKKRAKTVGEIGFHPLLIGLSNDLKDARFHLMGHSFGCIASSAAICGRSGSQPFKASSLALVQGALSLWSYSAKMPLPQGGRGYFADVLTGKHVTGPIFTTRSEHDRAVGFFYPIAAGVAGQVAYEVPVELPEYGGVGSFGAQGIADRADDMAMLASDASYQMKAGRVLNLEASQFIKLGGGMSGAHSDIAGAEVAHAVWSAAFYT
jgi:hypothetical protein